MGGTRTIDNKHQTHRRDSSGESLNRNHPWRGFAHPDHHLEEIERLPRALRYALIDIQKFWVEVQSVPVLRSGLEKTSLERMEELFRWILSSSSWSEKIAHPRLIGELADAPTRRRVQEFARSLLCIRSLRDEIQAKLGGYPEETGKLRRLSAFLNEAQSIVSRHPIGALSYQELEGHREKASSLLEESRRVESFFEQLGNQAGAPTPAHAPQAERVFRALRAIEEMPMQIRPWRKKQLLESSQRIRIQAWKDRARPLLEIRKRLAAHFNLEIILSADELRDMAEVFRSEGLFAHLKTQYRDALKRYRGWLSDRAAHKIDSKETGFQRAERLLEWANLIEQERAFLGQQEARALFAPNFKGVDTDFNAALEANHWAEKLRDELFKDSLTAGSIPFDTELIDYVVGIPEDRIGIASHLSRGDEAKAVRRILEKGELAEGVPFAKLSADREGHFRDFRRLGDLLRAVGYHPDRALAQVAEIAQRVDEAVFLLQRMEADEELKSCLKALYRGTDTDLAPIEQCMNYVKQVRVMGLPAAAEAALLAAHGPQRLADARSLVSRCLAALGGVREHFRKIETATHGQVRELAEGGTLENVPVVELMERIQAALKEPGLLGEAVMQLRQAREARTLGLTLGEGKANDPSSAHRLL